MCQNLIGSHIHGSQMCFSVIRRWSDSVWPHKRTVIEYINTLAHTRSAKPLPMVVRDTSHVSMWIWIHIQQLNNLLSPLLSSAFNASKSRHAGVHRTWHLGAMPSSVCPHKTMRPSSERAQHQACGRWPCSSQRASAGSAGVFLLMFIHATCRWEADSEHIPWPATSKTCYLDPIRPRCGHQRCLSKSGIYASSCCHPMRQNTLCWKVYWKS